MRAFSLLLIIYFLTHPLLSENQPGSNAIVETPITKEAYLTDKILIQGLDKVTGRVFTLEAHINEPISFGSLKILPRICQKAAPEEPPESTSFLEISEKKADGKEAIVFKGWMFSSHPSISALEHAVYDIWVKECSGSIIESRSPSVSTITAEKSAEPSIASPELKAFYDGLNEVRE